MKMIAFGEYVIPPISKRTTASYRAFSWDYLRILGWDVGYIEPKSLAGVFLAPVQEATVHDNLPLDVDTVATVDDDFVAIVEEVIAHRT